MGNKIEQIWQWLTRGSREPEEPAEVYPTLQDIQDREQTIARLEQTLADQAARQEAFALDMQRKLDALQERLTARELEEKTIEPGTGLYRWEAFLEKAEALLSQETPPAQLAAVCLDAACEEGLPELTPPVLQVQAEQWRSNPQVFLTREDGGKLCGILWGETQEELARQQQELLQWLEAMLSQVPPVGIHVRQGILGTAQYTGQGQTVLDLLEQAKLAAYTARKKKYFCSASFAWFEISTTDLPGGRIAFQELMEGRQINFLLQPIVRRSNAKVEGYELIPVSAHPDLPRMEQVWALADYLGRKEELENLVRREAMARTVNLMSQGRLMHNSRLFLKSMACLSDQDAQAFSDDYFDYLKNLVVEVKPPRLDSALEDAVRRRRLKHWGVHTVLGCSSLGREAELALWEVQPEWIRITADLICGIAADKAKQKTFKALKAWASARGAEVLADGIANAGDLAMAVRLGADYLQGEYLSKPENYPADLPEKRMAQIAEAQYGKRG